MKRHTTNQNGRVSILIVILCMVIGAIASKTGFVDYCMTALTGGLNTNRPLVELPQKTELLKKKPQDDISVEEILHKKVVKKNLKEKTEKPHKKVADKAKNQDSDNFSLAMEDTMRDYKPRGFLTGENIAGNKKKDKKEDINASELYQAYLKSWQELE